MYVFRRILRTFRLLLKYSLLLVLIILLLPLFNYIVPAKYNFPAPEAFKGDYWYNPYRETDSTHWMPANFHMHSRAWGGLTNGADTRDHEVYDTYKKIGFESISISNYQKINRLYSDSPSYIPAYEHGYGFYKNHHLCLGARKVVWYDLPYGQSIHHKQYILDRLRPTTEVLSINHPSFFKGYMPEDFTRLTGYDFIEALNGYRNSIPHWDSALSAGRPAFILADDDMHDISAPDEIGRRFLVVNSASNSRHDIISNLKSGKAFGVFYQGEKGESLIEKSEKIRHLPVITSFEVKNDTLRLTIDSTAYEVRFFGQHGRLLKKSGGSRKAFYALQDNDSYIRTVILFPTKNSPEGLQYFLNPVIRSTDGNKPPMPLAQMNETGTWISRIGLSLVALTFIWLSARIVKWRKEKRKS